MFFLYNCIVHIAGFILKLVALFNSKLALFVEGRRNVFSTLNEKITPNDQTIWFHAASLGEYEQGLPVIEKIKEKYPYHKIIVSFFSPSGFEVRKNNTVADCTIYLPLDTRKNAQQFIDLIHPEMVFFIKYEFWPNYLNELKKRNIKTYLISGILRENQAFFKWYGGFYRKALEAFTFFFVQNENSKTLLNQINFTNTIVSGDTRFDRVSTILEKDNTLPFIAEFKDKQKTIVIGSSWPKDEEALVSYINASKDTKFIIAPHNIKTEQINTLQSQIKLPTVLFSEIAHKKLANYSVMIVDTIGLLTKIYSYADLAYVGGGFGNPGVHNILEPATFGTPIVIGPNYSHFAEAVALVKLKGCISIQNKEELQLTFNELLNDNFIRLEKGEICSAFIKNNIGATQTIIDHVVMPSA